MVISSEETTYYSIKSITSFNHEYSELTAITIF
jgi:hypothetical protein